MTQLPQFLIFFSSVLLILFFLNWYVYSRLKKIFIFRPAYIGLGLFLLTASFIVADIVERKIHNLFTTSLYFVSACWLGIFFFLLASFLVLDLLFYTAKIFRKEFSYRTGGFLVLVIAALVSVYSVFHARTLYIDTISINSNKLERDIKIVQISDVHVGAIYGEKYLDTIVNKINSMKPDMLLITGDLFDESDSVDSDTLAPLKRVAAPLGTYFITGNHERYFGVDRALDLVKKQGVIVLRNEKVSVGGVELIGLDYPEREYAQNTEALSAINFDPSKFSVLMFHPPAGAEYATEQGINLMLSGHTHDGQIWPFSLLTRIFYRYIEGLYEIKPGTHIYVSSGTGTWGPPMRFLTRSVITEINLLKE